MSTLEKVPAHIVELAKKIKGEISFDADGVGSLPDDLFEKSLPEGISLELVKTVQAATLDFADAVALGLGEASNSHFKDHAGIDRTSVSVAMGHDKVTGVYDRKVMVRAPGSNEEKPKYGAVSLKLDSGIGAKRGAYKKIQEHLVSQATSIFAS